MGDGFGRRAYARLRAFDGLVAKLVFAVVMTLVLLWAGQALFPGPGTPGDTAAERVSGPTTEQTARSTGEGPADSTSELFDRCGKADTAKERARKAAAAAMVQWEIHVGAMNKLVLGSITLEQAQQFWDETRAKAAGGLEEFDDAERLLARHTARCPRPVGRMPEELRECAASVRAHRRELERASVALDTWRVHVHHMEMLRRGELTPEEATEMWLESWEEGNRQIDAYRSAADKARPVAGGTRDQCTG